MLTVVLDLTKANWIGACGVYVKSFIVDEGALV
jgi:hypothetical protein